MDWAASPAVALLSAVALQALKRSRWFPWLSRETERANNLVAILVATLTGVGLAVTFDWDQQTGQFAMAMSGNAYDLLRIAAHAPVQWAQQQGIYKLLIALPESAGETRDLQRQILDALQPRTETREQLVAALNQPRPTDVSGTVMEE